MTFCREAKITADPIKHVVVLILENHSFDQMLGCFKQVYPELEGIDPATPHQNEDGHGNSFAQQPTTERMMFLGTQHHEVDHVESTIAWAIMGASCAILLILFLTAPPRRQFIMGYYPLRLFAPLFTRWAEILRPRSPVLVAAGTNLAQPLLPR